MTNPIEQPAPTVRDNWRIACPECARDDELDIAAAIWVRLCADGTDVDAAACGDHDWDSDSLIACRACGHSGLVKDFQTDNDSQASASSTG